MDDARFQYSPTLVIFSISVLTFFLFGSLIPSVVSPFLVFTIRLGLFSMINFIPISWLYIVIFCIRVNKVLCLARYQIRYYRLVRLPVPKVILFWHAITTKYTARYQMWYYVLGSVLNVIISWHSTNVTILRSTTTNGDISTKCNPVVKDSICGTKCNNNNWSYPSNRAKYDTIVVTVILLWSYPGNSTKCISK